ncbi:nitrous oxide reductase apoprotein [Planifilum fimeticola]|uniref:Nitrous oxide reductase apoprotein n=1 Tax=Planifilum fimeticola TaxID=201975 RepID=A0A2T0LFJ1_9BACL|nr:Sec-dependent nitrous-oxide reductase [Planifilum fimeticola]PRX40995.1 nitrous oxide reductase apoprotein [Planifilum fimeticola]
MKLGKWYVPVALGVILGLVAGSIVSYVSPAPTTEGEQAVSGAFVPPGKKDEYYMFASGGHSGQVYVIGIPSMRRIRTIPVFSRDSATGYGWDEESKKMLGGYTWGDLHHPALSETDGEYDGRFLYVNDNANNRAAMIDLKTFTTKQILGPIPNIMGPHSAAFVTPNTEYFMMATRFSVPMGGKYAPLDKYSKEYHGALSAQKIDQKTGKMKVAWQLKLPPWNYDLSDAGKKISGDWAFFTTYNTEEATELLEINASANETDYLVAINWKKAEQAVKDKKFEVINGVKVVDPTKVKGIAYLIPLPKSPHGVDVSPDGRWIVGSGKLDPTVTVYDFKKFIKAIEKEDFSGTKKGLPVVNFESVKEATVKVGLGPLHTQFGPDGYAYTTLFVESAVAKWKLGEWKVLDKVTVHYSPGHSSAAEGDTVSPDGKYLVALNKLSKDRHLSVGPSHPENMQLIDISGDKMKVINEAPIDPEPHYAQMVKADKIKPILKYEKDEKRPHSVWKKEDVRIEREGNHVTVHGLAVRTRFYPDKIEVNEGDKVTIYLTNIDLDQDITHGFAINLYDIDVEVQPGETKKIEFVADKPGVYPFYCSNFCSALHQEMQGYLLVKPKK